MSRGEVEGDGELLGGRDTDPLISKKNSEAVNFESARVRADGTAPDLEDVFRGDPDFDVRRDVDGRNLRVPAGNRLGPAYGRPPNKNAAYCNKLSPKLVGGYESRVFAHPAKDRGLTTFKTAVDIIGILVGKRPAAEVFGRLLTRWDVYPRFLLSVSISPKNLYCEPRQSGEPPCVFVGLMGLQLPRNAVIRRPRIFL